MVRAIGWADVLQEKVVVMRVTPLRLRNQKEKLHVQTHCWYLVAAIYLEFLLIIASSFMAQANTRTKWLLLKNGYEGCG